MWFHEESPAWLAAQQLHEERKRAERDARAEFIINADWDMTRRFNDVLTVLEGGESDAA